MNRIALVFAVALALPVLDQSPAVSATGGDRPVAAGGGRAQVLSPERRPVRQVRPRIEIQPGRLLRRECVDATREVWRPYWGYVVMPGMRCWWVRE